MGGVPGDVFKVSRCDLESSQGDQYLSLLNFGSVARVNFLIKIFKLTLENVNHLPNSEHLPCTKSCVGGSFPPII